ncbi:hypothetical protein AB0F81_47295, partial [Actinoplanes sp. NPDC024001]|uniref:hypothetical protein n=1 Tax=Actinoplanes sp. NPDC024001 TaxID=3154598 RepID=UPI003405BB2F
NRATAITQIPVVPPPRPAAPLPPTPTKRAAVLPAGPTVANRPLMAVVDTLQAVLSMPATVLDLISTGDESAGVRSALSRVARAAATGTPVPDQWLASVESALATAEEILRRDAPIDPARDLDRGQPPDPGLAAGVAAFLQGTRPLFQDDAAIQSSLDLAERLLAQGRPRTADFVVMAAREVAMAARVRARRDEAAAEAARATTPTVSGQPLPAALATLRSVLSLPPPVADLIATEEERARVADAQSHLARAVAANTPVPAEAVPSVESGLATAETVLRRDTPIGPAGDLDRGQRADAELAAAVEAFLRTTRAVLRDDESAQAALDVAERLMSQHRYRTADFVIMQTRLAAAGPGGT